MKKIIVDENNHIAYQLIGNIYYPILHGYQLPLGDYAKEKKQYLKKYYSKKYVQLLKDKDFHYQLFILNCYCEQHYQKRLIEWFNSHPYAKTIEIKDFKKKLKKQIIEQYVHTK